MGKQVGFYAGSQDIESLADKLRKKGAIAISTNPTVAEPVIAWEQVFVSDESDRDESGFQVWLVRAQDLNLLKWGHYPNRGVWTLDQDMSPAVQFHGPYIERNKIHSGRLWFSTQKNASKPEDYFRWADSLLRIPKKLFTMLPKPEGYAYTHILVRRHRRWCRPRRSYWTMNSLCTFSFLGFSPNWKR